mmetsp:Transcript_11105/g.29827  ORF Transcript_11105/g.29827 Transcript_11105/m.29827 type:complete len:200 (+) Transcript_11105:80-679(+)
MEGALVKLAFAGGVVPTAGDGTRAVASRVSGLRRRAAAARQACAARNSRTLRVQPVAVAATTVPPASSGFSQSQSQPLSGPQVTVIAEPEEMHNMLADNELVCVSFHAKWCRKCIYLGPKFERLACEFSAVKFGKVDVNAVRELPKTHQITHIPAIHFFKRGELVHRIVGTNSDTSLPEKIRTQLVKLSERSDDGSEPN